jgi:hypothetical protein
MPRTDSVNAEQHLSWKLFQRDPVSQRFTL